MVSAAPRRALPYRLGAAGGRIAVKHAAYKDLRFLTGAGSVYATAGDLLRFTRALRDGVFGDGLWAQAFDRDVASWHGWTGRTNGYESSVDVLLSKDLVFVFLSNLQSAANWQARARIHDILAGRDVEPIPMPPPVADAFEAPGELVGTFGQAEITLRDGVPFRGDNEFYPIEGAAYDVPASGSRMRFERDADGRVDAIIATDPSGRQGLIPKSPEP